MLTKNANFRKNNVNNCVFSSDGVQNYNTLSGKLWRNFMICYVLDHFWHDFRVMFSENVHEER